MGKVLLLNKGHRVNFDLHGGTRSEWTPTFQKSAPSEPVFDLIELLEFSVFYPASGFDGRPIQYLSNHVQSFVYVDYGLTRGQLTRQLEEAPLDGYDVSHREYLPLHTLIGDSATHGFSDWIPNRPRVDIVPDEAPWADWLIFKRCQSHDREHGPDYLSLLFLCADGVAVYRQLYAARNLAPEALAIIQPGTGWGGNHTDFRNPDSELAATVLDSARSKPKYLICGGRGLDYREAFWPDAYPELLGYFQREGGNGIWKLNERATMLVGANSQ